MFRCDDTARLLAFFQADAVRFRDILHDLDSPCPAWDEAMRRCDFVAGTGFVLHEDGPAPEPLQMQYYADSAETPSLVARVRGQHVRVEGRMADGQGPGLVRWCREQGVETIDTWTDSLRDDLSSSAGLGPWEASTADYTTGPAAFRPGRGYPVRRLTRDDEAIWRRFVDRNAADPMVNARGGGQAVIRDFVFLCRGLPVDYYATLDGGEITGVVSVNPMTRTIDEVSMVFVEPSQRRRGFGHSLVAAATRDILSRGHEPGYCAGGNPQQRPDLHAMLTALGYWLVACPWRARISR